jgi:hypothetical protein
VIIASGELLGLLLVAIVALAIWGTRRVTSAGVDALNRNVFFRKENQEGGRELKRLTMIRTSLSPEDALDVVGERVNALSPATRWTPSGGLVAKPTVSQRGPSSLKIALRRGSTDLVELRVRTEVHPEGTVVLHQVESWSEYAGVVIAIDELKAVYGHIESALREADPDIVVASDVLPRP